MVADIAAPRHVTTCALYESAFEVSIALVSAAKVGHSRDLGDPLAAIVDLAWCSGSSRAESYLQELNDRNHRRSGCGGLWYIGVSAARNGVQSVVAAAGCGTSAR